MIRATCILLATGLVLAGCASRAPAAAPSTPLGLRMVQDCSQDPGQVVCTSYGLAVRDGLQAGLEIALQYPEQAAGILCELGRQPRRPGAVWSMIELEIETVPATRAAIEQNINSMALAFAFALGRRSAGCLEGSR
jgi:hypothetical protein